MISHNIAGIIDPRIQPSEQLDNNLSVKLHTKFIQLLGLKKKVKGKLTQRHTERVETQKRGMI